MLPSKFCVSVTSPKQPSASRSSSLEAFSIRFQRRLQVAVCCNRIGLTPLRRGLDSYTRVLLTGPFAKDVRLFGLADHILQRYREQLEI
jgi:hypothetical protein